MKTTKELIMEVLAGWGFPLLREEERHVSFRYQLLVVSGSEAGTEDRPAVGLTLVGLFKVDNEKEMEMGLRACNDVNEGLLHVKAYIDKDGDLILASEYFYKSEEDMEYLMKEGLDSLVAARKRFIAKYQELEEEARLLAELAEVGD